MAAEYGDRLRIATVDADAEPGIVARFDVRALPTLLGFRDGQLVLRLVGARSTGRLRGELADLEIDAVGRVAPLADLGELG
ncbi:MAG: thioredoxin family protein [Acidimicrobiales bacterium]